jgi:hypothetical protein
MNLYIVRHAVAHKRDADLWPDAAKRRQRSRVRSGSGVSSEEYYVWCRRSSWC